MEEALTKEKAVWMYQKMLEIRYFEDRVHQLFAKGYCRVLSIFTPGKKRSLRASAPI